jgi:hypothetical protein
VTVTRFLVLTLFAIMLTSCSVVMTAKQPDKKNVELFDIGTPRSMRLAEFGMPVGSERRDGRKYEIYKFVQDYSTCSKATRAVVRGAADLLTLGLWEVMGTPLEVTFGGDEIIYEVQYDDNSWVGHVVALKK